MKITKRKKHLKQKSLAMIEKNSDVISESVMTMLGVLRENQVTETN